jgi:cysteine desulfurase
MMTLRRIYLDNNATTRPLPSVIEAMARHMHDSFANPGSRHAEGRAARRAMEEARESIAGILGAQPREVIFTSGGTEANNLALLGLAGAHTPGTILLTPAEHPSTRECCRSLEQRGWKLRELDLDGNGCLVDAQLDQLPWNDIKLATIILAHNETGVVQNVSKLADACRDHRVPLHLDGVQMVGKLPVNFHELNATSLSLGAHKFHGPRGIGALLLRDGAALAPSTFGGHQESGRRPGTEGVALIVGMAEALRAWHCEQDVRASRISALRDRLERGLLDSCAPAAINGAAALRLPNTTNIAFPGVDGEALLVALDLEGIACSLGSTCASGSAEPAPVLVAMGCPPDVSRSSVRFSLGFETTESEIDEAILRISRVVARLRNW